LKPRKKTSQTGNTEPKSSQIEKTEPKSEKTEPEPVFSLKNGTNQTETSWFDPVSVFKKNSVWLFFFIKPNRTELKMIIPTQSL